MGNKHIQILQPSIATGFKFQANWLGEDYPNEWQRGKTRSKAVKKLLDRVESIRRLKKSTIQASPIWEVSQHFIDTWNKRICEFDYFEVTKMLDKARALQPAQRVIAEKNAIKLGTRVPGQRFYNKRPNDNAYMLVCNKIVFVLRTKTKCVLTVYPLNLKREFGQSPWVRASKVR